MHTVFEACDTDVQVVEYRQTVFLIESVKVNVLVFHVRTADGVDPLGLQNVYVGSFFCGMPAFGGIDVADYEMGHVGSQVETVDGTHAPREIIELVLSRGLCKSRCCGSCA
jgi:hypothetical protein